MANDYRSSMKASDFLYPTSALVADKWVEIGERVIKAGIYIAHGFGFSSSQSDADGRIYAKFQDNAATPVEVTGILRIAAYTPDDMPIRVLGEWHTSKLNSSVADMTKQLPFPKSNLALGQDYKYKYFFKAATVGSGVLAATNCTVQADMTQTSKAG